MKRYLLFGGDSYYPAGGARDLLGAYSKIDKAKAIIDTAIETHHQDARTQRYNPTMYATTSSRIAEEPKVWKVGDKVNDGEVIAVHDDGDITVTYPARDWTTNRYDWAHILDTDTGAVVLTWHRDAWDPQEAAA